MTVHGVRLVKYRPSSIFPVTISFMSWTVLKMVVTKKPEVLGIFKMPKNRNLRDLWWVFLSHIRKKGGPDSLRDFDLLKSWSLGTLNPLHIHMSFQSSTLISCHSVFLSAAPWSGNLVVPGPSTTLLRQATLRIS